MFRRIECLAMLFAIAMLLSAACSESRQSGAPAPETEKNKSVVEEKVDFPQVVPGEVAVSVTEEEKKLLLDVARKAFDLWVTKKETYKPLDLPEKLKTMKSNNVFATIYKDGDWRGCVASKQENIADSVVHAVINTCNDKRFKNPQPEEIKDFRVELSLLGPKTLIDSKDPEVIGKQLEPGVHGIYVRNTNGRAAFFLPYVFVKAQRTLETWLQRICTKGGMKADEWKSPKTAIYKFETINFIEDRPYGAPVDLYRYKAVIKDLKAPMLSEAVNAGAGWFADNIGPEGFLAGLDGEHRPLKKSDLNTEILALKTLGLAADRNPGSPYAKIFTERFETLAAKLTKVKDGMALGTLESPNLDATLLMAEVVATVNGIKNRVDLAKNLGNFLHTQLNPEGMFTGQTNLARSEQAYMLYLISELALIAGRDRDKEAVARATRSLNSLRVSDSDMACNTLALLKSGIVLKEDAIMQKASAIGNRMLSTQYTRETAPYADYIGAFKAEKGNPSTVDAALRLNALAKLYSAMKPEAGSETDRLYKRAFVIGARFLLEQQFTPISAFFFPNWKTANGAFKRDIILNNVDADQTARAVEALIAVEDAMGKEIAKIIEENREALTK